MLSLRYPSPEFLECRSVSVSDFNSITPAKSIFSPSQAIYMGHGCGSKNNPLRLRPFVSLVWFLLSHRFEIMENSKRSTEEALNRAVSSRQRLRRQEGATWDAPTIPKSIWSTLLSLRVILIDSSPPAPLLSEEMDRQR